MPSPSPELDRDVVECFVEEACFAATEFARVGVELEWLTLPSNDNDDEASGPAALFHQTPLADPLPGGSSITFEPGGQLELSSPACPGVPAVCDALSRDLASVRADAARLGVDLVGLGMDPSRDPKRIVDSPRYRAMEEYFSLDGPAGKAMMCSTAAVQVNLDTGSPDCVGQRWSLANALGPTLAASFANSPFLLGRPSGFKSTRLANWWSIDPSRTAPAPRGPEYVRDWARYALDARVMMIRRSEDDFVALRSSLSFAEWMEAGHELGHPTTADLEYHMSTLFPPVRPRGHFEVRYIDSLPDPWWRVAVAVTASLLDDPGARDAAMAATDSTSGRWSQAAVCGLEDPALAASAGACFRAALDALQSTDPAIADLAGRYYQRYVAQGRCPADERLEEWQESGRLTPDEPAMEASWT